MTRHNSGLLLLTRLEQVVPPEETGLPLGVQKLGIFVRAPLLGFIWGKPKSCK